MTQHEIFGISATLLQLYAIFPYVLGIYRREVKPHVFTWLIFSLLGIIAFAVQYIERAGPGLWLTGINALMCIAFTLCAIKLGTRNITRGDFAALILALLAIPVWITTSNPLWALVLICIIDTAALWPTVRKSWTAPYEENIQMFLLSGTAMLLSVLALTNLSILTALYPFWAGMLNLSFSTMLFWRRRSVNF